MQLFRRSSWLAVLQFQFQILHAKFNCPLYGLGYPKPTGLLGHPHILTANEALDRIFPERIDNANQTGSNAFSYAVQVFSMADEEPLWQRYWTQPNLPQLNSTGVTTVDGDTVFRIGSVTKILTILTFLAEVGDSVWNDPIAKYIPEIAALVDDGADLSHSITTPDWNSITIGSLASQMSGLMRDYALLGELTQGRNQSQNMEIGLPELPTTDIPPCGNNPVCNRTQFFEGISRLSPSFSPFVTPAYSDIGYALLGYALVQMTGKTFQQSLEDKVIGPLGLNRTSYGTPNASVGIIPGSPNQTSWFLSMGHEAPTGNVYSSATDLSKLGRAIMRSSVLPLPMTRRWLKPISFSSDPKAGVGVPWGVRQVTLPGNSTYHYTTIFNKAGSLGAYSTVFSIIPDFEIGFSILTAGIVPSTLPMDIADTLATTYLTTVLGIAREQANEKYAGDYQAAPEGGLNSSMSIYVDEGGPGLGVSRWISNGTDWVGLSVALGQNVSQAFWDRLRPSVRLYPSGLWDATGDGDGDGGGGRRVAFKAVFEDLALTNASRPLSTDCSTWINVAGLMYGSAPLDTFVFELDAAGEVTSVENAAMRTRLDKVSGPPPPAGPEGLTGFGSDDMRGG